MKNCTEIVESYINGNISYVRNELLGNSQIALKCAEIVKEYYGETEFKTFVRLMIRGD